MRREEVWGLYGRGSSRKNITRTSCQQPCLRMRSLFGCIQHKAAIVMYVGIFQALWVRGMFAMSDLILRFFTSQCISGFWQELFEPLQDEVRLRKLDHPR